MDDRLDIEQITERLKKAFDPYKCDVHADTWNDLIWIQILDQKGRPIVHSPKTPVSKIEKPSMLSAFIEQMKETIESKVAPRDE